MDECIKKKKKKDSTCSAPKISHYTAEWFATLSNIKNFPLSFQQYNLFTFGASAKMWIA